MSEKLPAVDAELRQRFAIHRPEARAALAGRLTLPTLNVRGMAAGAAGAEAANVIPHRAQAELDLRLAADWTPTGLRAGWSRTSERSGGAGFRPRSVPPWRDAIHSPNARAAQSIVSTGCSRGPVAAHRPGHEGDEDHLGVDQHGGQTRPGH